MPEPFPDPNKPVDCDPIQSEPSAVQQKPAEELADDEKAPE